MTATRTLAAVVGHHSGGAQRAAPRGFTLMELVVVLAVLGVMASVVGLALGPSPKTPTADGAWRRTVATARARALATGRPVHVAAGDARPGRELTALPDGSVLAAASDPVTDTTRHTALAPAVDRLTGHVLGPARVGDAAQ